jgi:hypothetical protein
MATLHDSLMQSFTLRESGVELEISRGDDGVVMMQRVPDPVADAAALGVGAYRDPYALSEAAGAPVTESEVMGTAAGVLPGAAIGAVTAVPDIAGLIKGGVLAATAEEGQRIQQFLDGFSSISGVIGSERAFELYEAGVDALPVSDEAKQGMKQGALVGEVLGFGTGAKAAGKGVADYAAGAPQRLEDAQSGVTLGMGVDPTQVVDEAIVAGQKLMGKDPAPVPQAMPDAIDLTPEERSASLIDDLYDGETTIESGGFLYDVAKRINERSKSLGTRIDPTPENQTKIAKVMAREALHAMKSKGNAGDWYREKVANAMRIAERVYPEVAADPNKANAIKFITAITSNGASVPENSKNTFAVFDQYLKTGKMPDVGFGKETGAMKKAFELHNNLVDEMGETEFYDFMNQEYTVREIDEIGKKYGFKVSGEGKDTLLPASVIFGPKIGGGFYQNLQGNYKPLTMDRWFMRTWGRYTGGLIVEQTAEAAAKQMERIRKSVTPEIAAEYGYNFDDLVADDTLLEELAYRAHKDYVKGDYKVKTELNKSSKNFVEAQKKVLEQPRTSKERNYMRSTVDEALDILRGQGVELDRAALQALIWYPEKELYAKLGIGTKKSAPTDYETEFATVAAERGVDVSDIVGNAQP